MSELKALCVTTILLVLTSRTDACPTSCVCKWKNGKQTVECVDKGMLIIPEGMDSGTQVLEFGGNNLRTLQRDKFQRMDLINLQRIYLARCHIVVVEDGTFKGLTNLVELDLSGNALESVPSGAFLDCPSLMRLTLTANPIKVLHKEAFGHLFFLNTLELSECQLTSVEAGAFDGLQSLERLRLDDNRLKTIQGTAASLPKHLQELDLRGNDWQCDCRMIEMRLWLEAYELPLSMAPMCAGPTRLARRTCKSIVAADYACLPDVAPTTLYLEIAEGKNISLQCHIRAVPAAHVSWWFHGQLLQNDTLLTPDTRLLYYVEEGGGEEKRSELFIYNTNVDDNGTFVCAAENAAGVALSNFTIRIVLKEEPFGGSELAQLPFEFVLIIVSATGVSLVVICFALVLSIVKCQSERRQRKKDEGRMSMMLSNSTKDSLMADSVEEFSELSKESSNPHLAEVQQAQMMLYGSAQTSEELLRSMSPILAAAAMNTHHHQLEGNPDLINEATESIGKRHEGDGEDKQQHAAHEAHSTPLGSNIELTSHLMHQHYLAPLPPQAATVMCSTEMYRLSADVHLNPIGLLNVAQPFANGSCYRTLPYNRGVKRQASLQETTHRYHRDAEFLQQAPPAVGGVIRRAPFEHFNANLRYTADGYPVMRGCCADGGGEQETQFSDTESVRSCCSAPAIGWTATPLVSILKNASAVGGSSEEKVRKMVVGAQTQTDITAIPPVSNAKPSNRSVCGAVKVAETLTESPDEGYEGDEQTKV